MTMREKPLYGSPCNRCGLCCMAEPCLVAQAVLGQLEGSCRALRADGLGGYICGLLNELETQPERDAARLVIGAGMGCDAIRTEEDRAIHDETRPTMREAVRREREKITPPVQRVLVRWVQQL